MGYVASAFARALRQQGWRVVGTRRYSAGDPAILSFDGRSASPEMRAALAGADAVLISIPPMEFGDPALAALAGLEGFAFQEGAWIGYLSTTGVYGDWGGAWVSEASPLRTRQLRSLARIAAETQWRAHGAHIFRLAGIYGPGRSPLDRLRAGDNQRIGKPGQVFSRIHVEDIVSALLASMARPNPGQVYNLCDDAPAPPQDVITYAAQLLGLDLPPPIAFEKAQLSPMAASFYADNRRVSNARAKAELGWRLRYPSYREGLEALWALEAQEGRVQPRG
jgi:nucleoside-diphosphate-sugar epimerase